jgi:hypothetical protein
LRDDTALVELRLVIAAHSAYRTWLDAFTPSRYSKLEDRDARQPDVRVPVFAVDLAACWV